MAGGCSLVVDVYTNKFYDIAQKQLLSLSYDDVTDVLGGGRRHPINIVGSSHGWIALCNTHNQQLYLWNPVSRRRINLPTIDSLPTLKDLQEGGYCRVVIEKAILSSSNPDDADCRVVVLVSPGRKLAFCCPGQSGADYWISIGLPWWNHRYGRANIRHYADMAYSREQNRLFCITEDPPYQLERWDLKNPWWPRMDHEDDRWQSREEMMWQYTEYNRRKESNTLYLVISEADEVFIVVRKSYTSRKWFDNTDDPNKTIGFVIFRAVFREDGDITVHPVVDGDTGGLAMFVGLNHSFALSATEFPELKPNSIYFTNESLPPPMKRKWYCSVCCLTPYDIGIFDCKNRKFYPCYCLQEHDHGSEGYVYNDNAEESSEEESSEDEEDDYDGSEDEEEEENSEEEEEDDDGSEDEDDDGSEEEEESSEEEDDYFLPRLVWFRPSSQLI